ncbi:MAG: hemolysin III family protein [Rhizobacter sp.]|nr:hemolysin III family protein [Burkholderiales bacterium]
MTSDAQSADVIKRSQSAREEMVNSIVHGIALLASLAAIPLLFQLTEPVPLRAVNIAGSVVFAATLLLLYLCSTLYHALPEGRARLVLLRLDHGAIYLFIAGSFTPFAMASLDTASGWMLLVLVWLLAALGFILKVCGRLSHPLVSTGLYLLMGWMVLTIAAPLIERLPHSAVVWLIAGGVAYTVGVVFFVVDTRMRYAHAIWHGFVVVGTSCHFVTVLGLHQ